MKTGPWAEFEARRQHAESAEQAVDDFAITHARLFSCPDGTAWLGQMRARLFGTTIDPEISNERLRFMEGQRQMIRDIDRQIELGNKQIKLARQSSR
jgi:hypothetical protein